MLTNGMSRIYETRERLDYGRIQEFYAHRSRRISELGPLRTANFGDEDLARRRDLFERETVLPHFGVLNHRHVLDIGCGVGRWGHELAPKVKSYLGIDPCSAFIEAAQAHFDAARFPPATHRFQLLSAQDLSATALSLQPPFDLVIIAGVMLYLNDEDIASLLERLEHLTAKGGILYVRVPVGLERRLTLKEHFSEELGQYYHAIYRSVSEYDALFKEALPTFPVTISRPLFPDELCNRKETGQHIFILEETGSGAHWLTS